MKHRSLLTIAGLPVLAALSFAAASCGGGGGSSTPDTIPADASVVIRAEANLVLDAASYTAAAANGSVKIAYVQDDIQRHTLVVQDSNGIAIPPKLDVVKKGAVSVGTYQLAPGTYTVHCDVPGHSATMRATLVVS